MKRTLIVAMVALLALPAFAQRSKTRRSTKRIKKTRKAKRVNINNSLQIEGSYEAISLGTNTSATNNIGQTAILGGDNSTNGMRLTVRQNYALSNNFFTSFGIGVRNSICYINW
jgi:Flp pilus assembly protein TadB